MSDYRINSLIDSETDTTDTSSQLDDSIVSSFPPASPQDRIPQQLENFTRKLSLLGLELKEQDQIDGMLTNDPPVNVIPGETTPTATPTTTAAVENVVEPEKKVKVRFQPIGSILTIKPALCNVSSEKPFATILSFLQKKLNQEFVFCYINNSFAPTPDQNIGDLWHQFNINNELIINYCAIVAFG